MKCKKCGGHSVKNGKVKTTGKQRYYCSTCDRSFIDGYIRKSYEHDVDDRIVALVKESCGIRSISRILKIAPNTVLTKIKRIGSRIQKPMPLKGQTHEMDEMYSNTGNKN